MKRLRTFVLLFLLASSLCVPGRAFQVVGGRAPAPAVPQAPVIPPTPAGPSKPEQEPGPAPVREGAGSRPARVPKRPRPGKGAAVIRRATPRFVNVTIVSTLPNGSKLPDCEVAVDDKPEEKGTGEQGRLVIPMEPGAYNVRVTKPGYVTDGREIEVKASSAYRQEESFTLRRVLVNLKVKTNPPGVKVSLDGSPESESDADGLVTFTKVDPSVEHTLRGSKENFVGEPVTVLPYQKEATIRLRRDLLTLKVKTYPPRADVYLDGDLMGTSDADGVLLIPKVKTGKEHLLRAEKDGVTQPLIVPPDYELAVIKLPSAAAGTQSGQGEPGPTPETKAGDEASPPSDDAPREGGTRQEDGAMPAPQKVETPTPTPTPQPQRGVEASPSVSALEVELKFWDSIKDSKEPEEFAAYLRKYPDGQFVDLARIRFKAALANKKAEPEPGSMTPAPEPAKPTPTPTPAPVAMNVTPVVPMHAPPPAPAEAQGRAGAADVQAASIGGAEDAPALAEMLDWLRRNFASGFTYKHTAPAGAAFARESNTDFAPLRFKGCGLEWRVFDVVHRV